MPHIRKLDVGTRAHNPKEITVSVTIPRAMTDLYSIENSLRELEQVLAERYPVKRVRLSRRMRNPADPTHWNLNFIVALGKPLITLIEAAMVNEAVRWFRKRFPGSKKKRSPRRTARSSKKKKR